ncbi:MAG: ABC transporter ATP-binding protein/permease [Bacteroidaceae bacterium]|nr:ABC transporter ATP-binding protein/permease [Bacteroidaceae bacterium]
MNKMIKKLGDYMGSRKTLLPWSIAISAVNGLLTLIPYILLWLVVRTLIISGGDVSDPKVKDYALWAFLISIVDLILYFVALMLSHLTAFRMETTMRKKAMENVMKAPLGFFENKNTGIMRKVIDENASETHTLIAHILPDLASSIVSPLGVIALLIIVDWQLGLATLIPIIISFGIMVYMMNPAKNHFQRNYLNALEKMSSEAVEYVRGIPVVKTFQQSVFSFKQFYDSIVSYRDLVIKYTIFWRMPMSLYTVVINSCAFILVPTGIIMIGHQGDTATIISDMILYVLIAPIIAANIMKIMNLGQNIFLTSEAIKRMEKMTVAEELSENDIPKKCTHFDINFENVSFRYEDAKNDAISNINLNIPEGTTIALVGESGSGKTTIARMIPRFWDVCEGCVKIGGIDIKQMDKHELMKNISFVFQNTRLFKTSILNNVCYGNPNATLDEVNRAINLSQSREIIDRLPNGLNTIIGSEGTYLSGGEQQRIVLARAILKNAPIIVLDEATAFADPENEHIIRQALTHLTKDKTVLMIAHRLTTVKDVDKIAVIEKGKIAEQGTHDELMAKKSLYYNMWNEYQKAIDWKI